MYWVGTQVDKDPGSRASRTRLLLVTPNSLVQLCFQTLKELSEHEQDDTQWSLVPSFYDLNENGISNWEAHCSFDMLWEYIARLDVAEGFLQQHSKYWYGAHQTIVESSSSSPLWRGYLFDQSSEVVFRATHTKAFCHEKEILTVYHFVVMSKEHKFPEISLKLNTIASYSSRPASVTVTWKLICQRGAGFTNHLLSEFYLFWSSCNLTYLCP